MTDDTAPGTGANDERRTDDESSENGEDLEAENRELRSRVEKLEDMLADVQDELTDVKRATDTDDGGVEVPGASDASDVTPELVTQGGQPTKVIGKLSDQSGIGVLGEATGSGSTTGVWGTVDSSSGEGVYGEGKNGVADGVYGLASGEGSSILGSDVAGVRAEANSTSNSSGGTFGVYATNFNDHTSATGILGQAGGDFLQTGTHPDDARGVTGLSNSSGNESAGVYGSATKGSGVTYGVYANTNSSDSGAVAIRAESDSDVGVSTDSNVEAGGEVAADGDLRTNANTSTSTSYLRFRDSTSTSGPRLFHSNGFSPDKIIVRGTGDFYCDVNLQVNDTTRQRTAGPVAKGSIESDATIAHAVNVDSVSWNSTSSWYVISLSDDDYWFDEYATYVTSIDNASISWSVGSNSPDMLVEPSDGNQHDFQFVTHKLIEGQASTSSVNTSEPDHELSEDQIESSGDSEPVSEDDGEPE